MFFKKAKPQAENKITVDDSFRHIAFIMDGNGRWAKKRGMPREYGHGHGAETFKRVARYCKSIGLKYMTVYAFSTENWKRPKQEVDTIMGILDRYLDDFNETIKTDHVHFRFIGDLSVFPESIRAKMAFAEENSRQFPFDLNIAVNYGGRDEIVHAANRAIAAGKREITESDIGENLYTAPCPDPDLIVRTGGELRLSNFLLWQCAYSEFYFSDTLWPDYSEKDVDEAVAAFYSRKRRYGGV